MGVNPYVQPAYWDHVYSHTSLGPYDLDGAHEWYADYDAIRPFLERVFTTEHLLEELHECLCLHIGAGSSNLGHLLCGEQWFHGVVINTDVSVPGLRIGCGAEQSDSLTRLQFDQSLVGSSVSRQSVDAVACRFQDAVFRAGSFDMVLDKGGLDALWSGMEPSHPVLQAGKNKNLF